MFPILGRQSIPRSSVVPERQTTENDENYDDQTTRKCITYRLGCFCFVCFLFFANMMQLVVVL